MWRFLIPLVISVPLLLGGLPPAPAEAAAQRQKQVSDDEIYDQVRRRLANDPDVKGGAFEVEVHEGVVTVKGVVEREKARAKAERLVKRVHGVKGVVNQITVKAKGS